MNIYEWHSNFDKISFDYTTALSCIKELKLILQKKTIFYGANITGKNMHKLFTNLDIPVFAFVDKNYKQINSIDKIPVYAPRWLQTLDAEEYTIITTCNPQLRISILEDMKKYCVCAALPLDGFQIFKTLQFTYCTIRYYEGTELNINHCLSCEVQRRKCEVFKKYMLKIKGFERECLSGADNQHELGYALGSICTLKCQDCVEMNPYAESSRKKFVSKDIILKDLYKMSECCSFIPTLEFVGGEPFLHPDLLVILQEIKKIENFGFIHIVSNGTVTPGDELCRVLSDPQVAVTISDYSNQLSDKLQKNIVNTIEKLKENEINYCVLYNKTWFKINSFTFEDNDIETLKEKFKNCPLAFQRLSDGVLYPCAHDYAGYISGEFTENQERILIHNFNKDQLVKRLEQFNAQEYYHICSHCLLPFNTDVVPSAIQIK